MKLLRLTSTDKNAYFDNTFNDDIVILPNSEVTLNSLSLELIPKAIEIDDVNNAITYQIKSGQGATIELSEVTYTEDTAKKELFNDITTKLNQSLTGGTDPDDVDLRPTGIALGLQFKANVVDETYTTYFTKTYTGRFGVAYRIKQERQLPATSWTLTNIATSGTGNATAYKRGTGEHDAGARALSKYPITKGCGHIRATFKTYQGEGDVKLRGVFMGITTNKDATTRAECEFGIQYPYADGDFTMFKSGVATDLTDIYTQEDGVGSIEIYNGKAYGVYYEWNNGNNGYDRYFADDELTEADSITNYALELKADGSQKDYYFMYIIYGEDAETEINYTIWNPDAWNSDETVPHDIGAKISLRALPTPSPIPGIGYIEFHPSLSHFLGYQHPRVPIVGTTKLGRPDWIWGANFLFKSVILADSYYVELLTMNIDSYDGLTKGRKNILAVIPQTQQSTSTSNTNIVIYEPNFPVFLDLTNKAPITLRTIRARVLLSDGSQLPTQSLGVMTLLFKKKKGFEKE
tara:strand:- start:2058 stop:3617 length:1560 start_codon:yes stop_codon:yes gene_type:complete